MYQHKAISGVIPVLLLILQVWVFTSSGLLAQVPEQAIDTTKFSQNDTLNATDTVSLNNNAEKKQSGSLEFPVYYKAKDSIRMEVKTKKTYLYGEAKIDYEDIVLEADYMVIDMDKGEVTATYSLDSLGNPVGKPLFQQGADEMVCDSIRYNFKSKKGLIYEVRTQQGEGYIHMSKSKRHENEHVHLEHGKYTTCNLEEPHFHFELSKAVIIPEKRIVTGPMNLWVAGVPTPLGVPFGYFPNSEEKKKGLLFPTYGQNFYGIFLEDIGYYLPINDYVDASFYGTIYTRGSWGVRANTNYYKRYKVDGAFDLTYQRFKEPFPDETSFGKIIARWRHAQDPKAHPSWKFNADVNFQSDNNAKNNLQAINNDFLNNTFQSDINVNKIFPGKPYSFNVKMGMKQNSNTQSFDFILPDMSFNVNRFYLPLGFLKTNKGARTRWFEQIGITYNLNSRNTLNLTDTLLKQENLEFLRDAVNENMKTGLNHNVNVQTSIKFFKSRALILNPTIRYNELWNFQTLEKQWNQDLQQTEDIINQGFAAARDLSMAGNLTTKFFGYYQSTGENATTLRHVMTPTVSFTYRPNLGQSITSFAGPGGTPITYSPFQISQFSQGLVSESGIIGINILNNFELKVRDKNDTITGYQKIKILEIFNINTGYDIFKDTNNWSDITLQARTNPAKFMSLNSSMRYSVYGWDEAGRQLADFALNNNGKLGRVGFGDLAVNFRFTSQEGRDVEQKMDELYGDEWGAELAYLRMHPNYYINFNVPWSLNLDYKITYNRRAAVPVMVMGETVLKDTFDIVQTIGFSGDINITQNWKIALRSGFDVKEKQFSYTTIDVFRDMHCWQMHFYWVPFGANKSYNLQINAKASMLQDMKLVRRRPNWDY